ncbi:DUF6461 domain-containing protein [Litorihabitans aurantiacus]|uniref:Uncharacterized protein n=1 Tax=Litorihabitans aurantiacus TaxID=1930061 RepID=A0AA37XEX5_9MICO|nr:DUF6461 domain-containing protein [Litorihabitans aurantiacus]GMA32068.1 hypothetical protein GCM10025875_20600 [Litorihabitans aurantiacus]
MSTELPTWITATELADAATITVVRDGDLTRVAEAFGAHGEPFAASDPSVWELVDDGVPLPWGVVAALEGGVVVIEPNGWVGSTPEVLASASVGGLAVAVYWNVNMLTEIAIVEDGVALGGISDMQVHTGARFDEVVRDVRPVPSDPDPIDAVAWGLEAQAALARPVVDGALWSRLADLSTAYRFREV